MAKSIAPEYVGIAAIGAPLKKESSHLRGYDLLGDIVPGVLSPVLAKTLSFSTASQSRVSLVSMSQGVW